MQWSPRLYFTYQTEMSSYLFSASKQSATLSCLTYLSNQHQPFHFLSLPCVVFSLLLVTTLLLVPQCIYALISLLSLVCANLTSFWKPSSRSNISMVKAKKRVIHSHLLNELWLGLLLWIIAMVAAAENNSPRKTR